MPEIMIPLVMNEKELEHDETPGGRRPPRVAKETGVKVEYLVGTMIELPRAALRAGRYRQQHAEFFSFGTNDLTQTTLGLSRDDAASFIEIYKQKGVLEADPFVTIDQDGVGELIQIAAERGRKARPDIKLGICGEHGGDPASIAFCQNAGLNYVSCSPYRVPVASDLPRRRRRLRRRARRRKRPSVYFLVASSIWRHGITPDTPKTLSSAVRNILFTHMRFKER